VRFLLLTIFLLFSFCAEAAYVCKPDEGMLFVRKLGGVIPVPGFGKKDTFIYNEREKGGYELYFGNDQVKNGGGIMLSNCKYDNYCDKKETGGRITSFFRVNKNNMVFVFYLYSLGVNEQSDGIYTGRCEQITIPNSKN
jgi:hypothetical protein